MISRTKQLFMCVKQQIRRKILFNLEFLIELNRKRKRFDNCKWINITLTWRSQAIPTRNGSIKMDEIT